MTLPPLAAEAKPALHFTGRADLLSSFAELRMDILRARCNGRANRDAERRQMAIRRAFNVGDEAAAAGRLK